MSDHTWQTYDSGTSNETVACSTCGICKRADGRNKQCPGRPPVITVRSDPNADAVYLPALATAEHKAELPLHDVIVGPPYGQHTVDSGRLLSDAELEEMERLSLTPHRAITFPTIKLRRLVEELRESRLSDQRGRAGVTEEDKEALRWLVRHVNATTMPGVRPRRDKTAALAVLDRLLKDTP